MAYQEFVTPHFVATERFSRDLGTASHRRTFQKACRTFREIRSVADAVLYPARHPAARAALAALPIPQPPQAQLEKVFDLMEEAARRELHNQLVAYSVERFEAEVHDIVGELFGRLASVLEKEAARIEDAERTLAASWRIPHYRSPLLESVAGTARELRERVAQGFQVFNGDEPEKILAGWFNEPIERATPAAAAAPVSDAA